MAISFCPNGLQAIKSITAASWSGQTQTFQIGNVAAGGNPTAYRQNIYNGDPVYLNGGSICSFNTKFAANEQAPAHTFSLGVFVGCSYESAPNTNTGFNTTSSGNPIYTKDTLGYKGAPVSGQIISDPNVVYTVLVANVNNNAAAALTLQDKILLANAAGRVGYIQYCDANMNVIPTGDANATTAVGGNLTTGMSYAFMPMGSLGVDAVAGSCPVRILGISSNPSLNTSPYDDYLFVDVILANHLFNASFGVGVAAPVAAQAETIARAENKKETK